MFAALSISAVLGDPTNMSMKSVLSFFTGFSSLVAIWSTVSTSTTEASSCSHSLSLECVDRLHHDNLNLGSRMLAIMRDSLSSNGVIHLWKDSFKALISGPLYLSAREASFFFMPLTQGTTRLAIITFSPCVKCVALSNGNSKSAVSCKVFLS